MQKDPNKMAQLRAEFVEQIKAMKVPANLPTTIEDAAALHDYFMTKLGVYPSNSYILAAEADRKKIYRELYVPGSDIDPQRLYYEDEMNPFKRQKLSDESSNVPSHYLPGIKFQYNIFCSNYITQQHMQKLGQRVVPQEGLMPPSYESYKVVMAKFKEVAKANPDTNYLFIQAFATHGYNYGGTQACATPYFDAKNNELELIEVEKDIRAESGLNTFYWVLFVCCRELKKRPTGFTLPKCLGNATYQEE